MSKNSSQFTAHRNTTTPMPASWNAKKLNKKIRADPISRMGYRDEILCLQCSHFPPCRKKLTRGSKFLAFSGVPHCGHCERHRRIPLMVSPSTFSPSLSKSTEPSDQKSSHISIAIIRIMI